MHNLVQSLLKSYEQHISISRIGAGRRPDKTAIIEILDKLQWIVFPGFFGKQDLMKCYAEYYVGEVLETVLNSLKNQLFLTYRLYKETCSELGDTELKEKSLETAQSFLMRLPLIREYLETDVQAAFDGDPAAINTDEIVYAYPGIYATFVNRVAHQLYLLDVPLIPRIMTEHAHSVTGIDIHPGATIGKYFFMDHGTGIVVGETTVIGNNVKLYQGVTLGALSTRGGQTLRGVKRHPTLEDGVTVYSGASILGGETIIGKDVTIASNAFVTSSVLPNTRVSVKNPELRFRESKNGKREG